MTELEPSLQFSGRSQRYPNQFFDLAQQYMPPTIKELFRWCTFYYYNSPLIGAAIKKVSRYPITDFIFEDEHESVRDLWQKILVDTLKMKDKLMEVNLDYHAYGNSFVSVHLPFTRFLVCKNCKASAPLKQWDWTFRGGNFVFHGNCAKCGTSGPLGVRDVPYKDLKGIRIVRWNPENISLKFNEYTGRYIYMYSVPGKLKNAIMRGDKDVLEDIPLIVIEAIKQRRMVRLNPDSIKHLKSPTLAEQDQGWGKPTIIHVLKDMFYLYTLRRAQEAIALEHIVPFDLIYPLPNAQQDPYIHTDLANWRNQIEGVIQKHRRDPNFKAVIPIPVGFGRLGGDGKALMLSPEMNYLTQTIVGGMGIPQEFLFGGLNYTGSSISLRTLENDFIQNRSQLLDLVMWIADKIRIWMSLPRIKKIRFADFRMADDVQKNQQLIGLNAQGKVSDQTLLAELGYDFDQEIKKMIEEVYVRNYLADLQAKGNAKSQGEASLISFNYQQKVQELASQAQQKAQDRVNGLSQEQESAETMQDGLGAQPGGGQQAALPPGQQEPQLSGAAGQSEFQSAKPEHAGEREQEIPDAKINTWAQKLVQMQPQDAQVALQNIKQKMPQIAQPLEAAYKQLMATATMQTGGQGQNNAKGVNVNMSPMPQQRAPRRAEAM